MSKPMVLNLDSEAFNAFKSDFNMILRNTLATMQQKEVEDASIMGCSYIAHDWDSALHSWTINHVESERLDRIYQFLESLGYEMSDEEKQLQNGTHPLFAKSEAA